MGFNAYDEKDTSDKTTKCIELCVTIPPFQFPHCNFTGIDKITHGKTSFYFASPGLKFKFNDVWKVRFHLLYFIYLSKYFLISPRVGY